MHFLKNSIFPGLPGAEIHFERHRKIVKTIRPGERALLLDPRVKPFAVVSTKPIPLEMPPDKENVSKKLERLGNTDLTLEFLSDLTEIDEIDVSEFDLTETEAPQRRTILEGLRGLADHYGLEIVDHLPLGNMTSEDYLRSLALPLANSITRLEQSTDTLKEITEEEISEEISANVADKEIGVLEIQKIIKQIESITETLKDLQNEESIVQAKDVAMGNAQQGILAPQFSAIESLIAQVQAKTIDTAGLERYMSETQELLDWIENELDTFVPNKRNFSGIASFLLGLLLVILLPGWIKWLSLPFFGTGIILLAVRYLVNAKVDVPDGYSGVVCHFGNRLFRAFNASQRDGTEDHDSYLSEIDGDQEDGQDIPGP